MIRPSWRNYIEYVDLAAENGDEKMARFRDHYAALTPAVRNTIMPEDICKETGVTVKELIRAVSGELWDLGTGECSMISSIAQPILLGRTIELAKRADHFHDRELCYRMWGMLPDRKGSSINIINNPMAEAGVTLQSELAGTKLKSFDQEVIDMTRTLEVPASLVLVKDVPPEDN